MNMNKNHIHSYKSNSDFIKQSQITNSPQLKNVYHPIQKPLPTIDQIDSSPHKQFNPNINDQLQINYQSRLIQQQSRLMSIPEQSLPNDSQILNVKQRQLLNKIYQKQKQLVMLQDKLYQLKNSNECLRQTITEINAQKNHLYEELESYHQKIQQLQTQKSELNQKIKKLQQKFENIQEEKREQQQFFKSQEQLLCSEQVSLLPPQQRNKTKLSFIDQTYQLRQQIQSLKQFYEQQIYKILNRNEQNFKYLQEKNFLVEQKNHQLEQKVFRLQNQIILVNNQKKQMLEYYLNVIEEMNREINLLKDYSYHQEVGNNNRSKILSTDQVYSQDNFGAINENYHEENVSFLNEYNQFMKNNNHSIDVNKMVKNNIWNQWITNLVKKKLRKQIQENLIESKHYNPNANNAAKIKSNSNQKSIQKSESASSLKNINSNISNLENSNFLNLSFTNRNMLNSTSIKDQYNYIPVHDKRQSSKTKYTFPPTIISSTLIHSKNDISNILLQNYHYPRKALYKNPQNLLLNHKIKMQKSLSKTHKQKYDIIDKKLLDIKNQLTKEILKH